VTLTLRVVDLAGPSRWRWLLRDDETGSHIADHPVRLDESMAEYEAFCDLYGYLRRNRVPDDPVASEAAIVTRVGRWIGKHVFGSALPHMLAGTVRVEVPREAEFLLDRPLELAHVAGQTLAASGVTLVYSVGEPTRPRRMEPIGDRLRMLALFPMPVRLAPLGLRQERFELTLAVRRIAAYGRAVELRVLQYGVTRQRLAECVEEYPGWDLLHVSGHGARGALLLERPDGSPDLVSAAEFLDLLRPAGGRLKFIVLSMDSSGAGTAPETLRLLGLDEAAERLEAPLAHVLPSPPSGLARTLLDGLGVAVLAMRYPVTDSFARALSREFYPRVLSDGMPVDRALAVSLREASGGRPSAARPAVSVSTPVLLGPADGLRLAPPAGPPDLDSRGGRMAWFPDEPARFVGRVGLLSAAGRALAPSSRSAGVLLLGMTGLGKTACAVELAYQHQDRFTGMVWWQAPTVPDEFGQSLASFAHAVESQLGLPMLHAMGSDAALRSFLPRLRSTLRDNALLLVLDNIETLLATGGVWRDPRWGQLLETLVGHGGLSRLVLTGRVRPADLDDDRVPIHPVHALSLAESVLLAAELPHLSRLLHDDVGAEPPDRVMDDRRLVRQVLEVVQGHPKLLELADAAAASPTRLRRALAATTDRDGPLEAFFTAGLSDLDAGQFLRTLDAWTHAVTSELRAPARLLADLLPCLEGPDRRSDVVEAVWSALRAEDDQAGVPFVEALDPLRDAALVDLEGGTPDEPEPVRLRIHPGVAEAMRAKIAPEFRELVDRIVAEFWVDHVERAGNDVDRGGSAGREVVYAALAAMPYLLRGERWTEATRLLELATRQDASPALARQALGYLRLVRRAQPDLAIERLYASLQARVDPQAAQEALETVIASARAAGRPDLAAAAAADLVTLLVSRGDLAAALDRITEKSALDREAGRGPWTEAYNESVRLRVLAERGEYSDVLVQARALLDRLGSLPPPDAAESMSEWRVREATLGTARAAALALQSWQLALDLGAGIRDSQQRRDASPYDRAVSGFQDYRPLLELDRLDEAEQLLLACQSQFDEGGELGDLGAVFSARAELEWRRERLDEAIALNQVALRYRYRQPVPHDLAVNHHNLAVVLSSADAAPPGVIGAHRLAAALLFRAVGRGAEYAGAVRRLAADLQRAGPDLLPADFGHLVERVQQVPGVQFDVVMAQLVPDAMARAAMLAETIDAVRHTPADDLVELQLRQWAPVIPVVVAAAGGDRQAVEELRPLLTQLESSADWRSLVAALRAIVAGERDRTRLDRLDQIDSAIVTAVLDRVDR
jgi:hypothetical protein